MERVVTLLPWLLVDLVAVVVGGGTTAIDRSPSGRELAVIDAHRHARGASAFAIVAGRRRVGVWGRLPCCC
ncbi:hypothetical protein [Geodermatophilus sp. FMUSA9-8]|uniref:hypothetical protein n=1 Tax=Geodermatophilus sp. FMUSA9-8 TaxID=3120155 RepID=UPI003008309A